MKLPSLEPESSASANSATLAYSVFSDLIKIPCFLSKVKSLFKNIFEGLMESKNLCFPVDFGSTKNYFFLCSHPPILHAPPPSKTDFPNIIGTHQQSWWFFRSGQSPKILATPKGVGTVCHLQKDYSLLPVNGSMYSLIVIWSSI